MAANESSESSSTPVMLLEADENALDLAPFEELIFALEEVRSASRVVGEVLLQGNQLILNRSLAQLELIGEVEVIRDEGHLSSELIRGWLSGAGVLKSLEAVGDVQVVQGDRVGRGDWLEYDWVEQTVLLRGRASVADSGVILHGEQFSGRVGDMGPLVCEPNAWLEVDSLGEAQGGVDVRARQAILNRSDDSVRFEGSVRVRGVYGALNCEKLMLQMKEVSKLDWLRAESGVVFQYGDVMAKAGDMYYNLEQDTLTLMELPRVMQGRSVVCADEIQIWPKERRVICEPHAKAVLFPDQAAWQAMREELSSHE